MQFANNLQTVLVSGLILVNLFLAENILAATVPPANDPPLRCMGYGNVQSISLSDWESGLGSWTTGTHDVAKRGTFDTPDWAVVGNLPGGQSGTAAFVANLNSGDCGADDESGALNLDSPLIVLPVGPQVPRISFKHWFDIEQDWDGGNLKISVNGGPFNLVPKTAIEVGTYSDSLLPAQDEDEFDLNTNPLAGQDVYTGTYNNLLEGSWIESHVNLLGIAAGGDSVRLRFDFGVDGCSGAIGWYIDEVEFYRCDAELPPSDCGNEVIDPGEQCDDGNDFIEDGCSNTCQLEEGWQCTEPIPPGTIDDPGFEDGRPNAFWDESSTNPFGSPICDVASCGTGAGVGPAEGTFWAWFGGVPNQLGTLSQSIVIPTMNPNLAFELEVPVCAAPTDFVEISIDGTPVWTIDGTSPLCGEDGYTSQVADISAFADDGSHDLEIHSESGAGISNFFFDEFSLPGGPSVCAPVGTSLTLVKQVINNNGGTALESDWTLNADGPTPLSDSGPVVESGKGFAPGTYDLSESGGSGGYNASAWVCDGNGSQDDDDTITLAMGQSATCTIINDDIGVIEELIFENGFE